MSFEVAESSFKFFNLIPGIGRIHHGRRASRYIISPTMKPELVIMVLCIQIGAETQRADYVE